MAAATPKINLEKEVMSAEKMFDEMLIRDEEVKVGKHMCGSLTEDYKPMEATHGLNGIDDSIQELPMSYVVETLVANGSDNSLPKDIAPSPLLDSSSRVKEIVEVPLESYMIEFVLSEKEDGGTFDNKNGMYYHMPILGGIVKEPPTHIVHIAIEVAPIAKVGGICDVASLSHVVQYLNHNVNIILSKYDCLILSYVKDLIIRKLNERLPAFDHHPNKKKIKEPWRT
ncbi:hypothetical protein V6N13_030862 [Hibiscus sabdariffa]|uniref:Uncharacterized protein n=2 Tax=Hibiscus sabdariffa TaxID=183260 RepID=A0ABR2D6G4_9ROSI